jgi:endonuclease/exonuclease/phosphatase family metal-dependent hydrolase
MQSSSVSMRIARLTIAIATSIALTGCMQRGMPRDTRVEATYPVVSTPRELPRQLRVATFNVHMEPAAKLLAGIKQDAALREADLILMQEVHRDERGADPCSAACGVGKALGYFTMYAPGHAAGNGSDGVAILSRVPILSSEVLELPYFNVHYNSGRRVALAVTVDVGGTPVTVYSVHLDNRLGVKQRRKQMIPVLEHAARRTTPVIIAGDFNTSPFTWFAHMIPFPTGTQDDRFEKLVRDYGFETPCRKSGATHTALGMKLDAIYTRGLATKTFAVGRAAYVSDHLPLWAVLEMPSSVRNDHSVVSSMNP